MKRRSEVAVVGAGLGELREERVSTGLRYWLISKLHQGRTGTLTLRLDGGGRALPVFSLEEEAEMFLRTRGVSQRGWTVWEAREILPGLGTSCAGVEKVVLDPISGVADVVSACLVGVNRERFAGRLVECLRGRNGPAREWDEGSAVAWDSQRGDGNG